MQRLPSEVLAHVLSFLPLRARVSVLCYVNRAFNHAVQLSMPRGWPRHPSVLGVEAFKVRRVSNDFEMWPAVDYGVPPMKLYEILRTNQRITMLHMKGPILSCGAPKHSTTECGQWDGALTSLQDLSLMLHTNLPRCLRASCLLAANATSLVRLCIAGTSLLEMLPSVGVLPSLRHFELRPTVFTGTSVTSLRTVLTAHASQLECVCIYATLRAEDFPPMTGSWPNLRSLELTNMATLGDAAVRNLCNLVQNCPKLFDLSLDIRIAPIVKVLRDTNVRTRLKLMRLWSESGPEVIETLQNCPRLTTLFPLFPYSVSASAESELNVSWCPPIEGIGEQLHHISVPWTLQALPERWANVWRICTRITSLELAAFPMWLSTDRLDELPFGQLERLRLRASDFDVEKSHKLCLAILPLAPRLRHLTFLFDEVNGLEYNQAATTLLPRVWGAIAEHCPNMCSFIWRPDGDPEAYAHLAEQIAPKLQQRNPWVELCL